MDRLSQTWRASRTLWLTLIVLALLFTMAVRGMETKDWVITLLRGLSFASITFLVAAGFSLIFGLMDVLNMAHGTFYMIGAYVGWTVLVRPDTVIDVLVPILLVGSGFALLGAFETWISRLHSPSRAWPWVALVLAGAALTASLSRYPVTKWDPEVYANSPVTNAFEAGQGILALPQPIPFAEGVTPGLVIAGLAVGGLLASLAVAGFVARRREAAAEDAGRAIRSGLIAYAALLGLGFLVYLFNDPITEFVFGLDNTWLFVMAVVGSVGSGAFLGALTEISLIRPLYERTIYQIMLTLGLGFIGIEVTRAVWGLQEFGMPRPSIFNGTGEGCPADSLSDLIAYRCSTISVLGGRIRTYNEVFVPILGVVVLIGVWLLLKRTRLGMIIRAGVQDREMVEALGINVRRVFTLVFALGVGLAALGGVIGAPSTGLTTNLSINLLITVLIALAIGGLTSYPGAALGSLIVGLLQLFIIKYGQIGIKIPFLEQPFKPTPPLVPATTVLLMVVILLVMPQGLLGRRD